MLEPLGEVLDDLVGLEEGGEASVDNLGSHVTVRAAVGQQEAGAERRVLLLDLCSFSRKKSLKIHDKT